MRLLLLLCARVLPWAVLVGLWALFGPARPYDGGDRIVMLAIAGATIGAFLLFHRLTDGLARKADP